jgi:hypothetical protein
VSRTEAVADLWDASGSVTLNGETDRENRSSVGIVDTETGVDELYVGVGCPHVTYPRLTLGGSTR